MLHIWRFLSKRKWAVLIGLIAIFGVFAGLLRVAFAFHPEIAERMYAWKNSEPLLAYSPVVDIGEVNLGDDVKASFTLSNVGYAPLVISGIQTSCSCMGLERVGSGDAERISGLTLSSGATEELALHFRVPGTPGQSMRMMAHFATNDPLHPACNIEVVSSRIKAGLITVPYQIVLNTVTVGTPFVCKVEVRDSYSAPRGIRSVATLSDIVVGRFIPCENAPLVNDNNLFGTLVGHLELTLNVSSPGTFAAEVLMTSDEVVPTVSRVPITGIAYQGLRMLPSVITLPRHSDRGLLFDARCICRAQNGAAVQLTVVKCPEEMQASVESAKDGRPGNVLVVSVRDTFRSSDRAITGAVQVLCKSEGSEYKLEIPVEFRPTSGKGD
jgi:hypothetical protein